MRNKFEKTYIRKKYYVWGNISSSDFHIFQIIFLAALFEYKHLTLKDYVYPSWSIVLGWTVTLSSLSCIPLYGLYMLITLKGTPMERLVKAFKPMTCEHHQHQHQHQQHQQQHHVTLMGSFNALPTWIAAPCKSLPSAVDISRIAFVAFLNVSPWMPVNVNSHFQSLYYILIFLSYSFPSNICDSFLTNVIPS